MCTARPQTPEQTPDPRGLTHELGDQDVQAVAAEERLPHTGEGTSSARCKRCSGGFLSRQSSARLILSLTLPPSPLGWFETIEAVPPQHTPEPFLPRARG